MPNINITHTGWLDFYDYTKVTPGTPVNIQNQSDSTLRMEQGDTRPTNDHQGFILVFAADKDVDGTQKLWLRGGTNGINVFWQKV